MGISHNSAICRSTLLLAHSVYVEWHAMRNKSESEKWENSMHCLLKYHPAALWSMYSKRLLRCVLLFPGFLFYSIARMSQAGYTYFEIWINGDKCNNTATTKDIQMGFMALWVTAFWTTLRDRFAVKFMTLWDFQVQSHSLIPQWLKYRGRNLLNEIVLLLVHFSSSFCLSPRISPIHPLKFWGVL